MAMPEDCSPLVLCIKLVEVVENESHLPILWPILWPFFGTRRAPIFRVSAPRLPPHGRGSEGQRNPPQRYRQGHPQRILSRGARPMVGRRINQLDPARKPKASRRGDALGLYDLLMWG